MDTKRFSPGPNSMIVTRVADGQWHVLDDDLVVGRGHSMRRPDGRLFISIDAWRSAAFGRLAETMLADLPGPLYTVVDEADTELTADWQRAGFTVRRREWEFVIPTDPLVTGLASARPPSGVRIIPAGEADQGLLRALDRTIRDEVEAGAGWQSMPAEIYPFPQGVTIVQPARYAVAATTDRYVGLLRLAAAIRRPRIGLIAVLAGEQRRGIARALLSHVLGTLHLSGTAAVSAEADESSKAALALLEGMGGRRIGRSLELAR